MNLQLLLSGAQQQNYPLHNQPLSRSEKTADFVSSALPTAILIGARGLSAAGAGARVSSTTLSSTAGTLGPAASVASIAGGILGAIQIGMNWGKSSPAAGASSGVAVGATVGTMFGPGLGTAIGAGIGALAGGLIGCITAGKHKDQKVRDSVRSSLVDMGILNSDHQLQLADGSLYDMGKAGGPRAEFGGRRPFEVDFLNPLAHYAVGWMNPIVALLAPGNSKIATDFTGYFANAALSNAKDLTDVQRNINSFLGRFGLSNDSLAQGITQLAQGGYIDQGTAQAWIEGIHQRMSPSFRGDFEMTQPKPETNQAGTKE